MKSTLINITTFDDYTDFIRVWVDWKRKNEGFSFRKFCEKSGFRSPSYLKLVIDGKRAIALKSIATFAKGLELNPDQTRFFSLLVQFKHTKDPNARSQIFEDMLAHCHKSGGGRGRDKYDFLRRWQLVAIRELIAHPDFKDDLNWLREHLFGGPTLWEIKDALKTLSHLGLIKETKGRWRQASSDFHTGPEVRSLAAFQYHTQILEDSKRILRETPDPLRYFTSTVSLMDSTLYQKIKKEIVGFQDRLVDLIKSHEQKQAKGSHSGQELYMLNMQLLPFTKFFRKGTRP